MKVFNAGGTTFDECAAPFPGRKLFPEDSIVLHRTPFNHNSTQSDWDNFFSVCRLLKSQINPKYLFVDASWDPVTISNEEIQNRRQELGDIFNESKVCILSARAQHYFDNVPGCLYYPMFLMIHYSELNFRPRVGRIGCLNRRNAAHRCWLMFNLLDQKLIDPSRDIYSMSFVGLYDDSYNDVDYWLNTSWVNQALKTIPQQIATHPDNFFNDYSIDHPAWHTGIAIITETEVNHNTIICEKTGKGILSKSCFSIYMDEVGYQVLEHLGFRPRFFDEHAQGTNIDPILKICKDIQTEKQALDYRQMHMDKIEHNFAWFDYDNKKIKSRPWFKHFVPKLQQVLDNL